MNFFMVCGELLSAALTPRFHWGFYLPAREPRGGGGGGGPPSAVCAYALHDLGTKGFGVVEAEVKYVNLWGCADVVFCD
jgi:hypothetical protein